MNQIKQRYGLPFIEIVLVQKSIRKKITNALIDTGSASTIISAEMAIELGLGPAPDDIIRSVQGVGGIEFVYEKYIDKIELDSKAISNFKVQVGAMDYGFDIDAILGMDFLTKLGIVIDLSKLILYIANEL